jgi:S-adenosylmethionine synthetase
LSVQHAETISLDALKTEMRQMIVDVVMKFEEENNLRIFDENTEIIVNNAGSFIMGGAIADAGLTGRKIIADTYGGYGRHGGGAFSGKDYTKVDRSAAYYARYAAKKIVDANLADIVEIQVSYIIGDPKPVAVDIETFETEKVSKEEIYTFINENFDFRLANIIEELELKTTDYTKTSTLGHFGKNDLK